MASLLALGSHLEREGLNLCVRSTPLRDPPVHSLRVMTDACTRSAVLGKAFLRQKHYSTVNHARVFLRLQEWAFIGSWSFLARFLR